MSRFDRLRERKPLPQGRARFLVVRPAGSTAAPVPPLELSLGGR